MIDLGDIERAAVTFDVTSAIEVQRFAAHWRAAGASSSNGLSVTREDGQYRCEVPPGDYKLSIGSSSHGEGSDCFVIPQTLQVVVPPGGTRVALALHHGGRIRLQVRDNGGVFLAGSVTLVGPDGATSKPGLEGADGYHERDGKLRGNGPVVTSAVLAPGTDAAGAVSLARRIAAMLHDALGEHLPPGEGPELRVGYDAVANLMYCPTDPVELLGRAATAVRTGTPEPEYPWVRRFDPTRQSRSVPAGRAADLRGSVK